MNAISKRLLSWLCVIAMVLSVVPVMDLSGFAIETKAVEYGSANWAGLSAAIQDERDRGNELVDDDAAIEAYITQQYCPMCDKYLTADSEKWTAGNGSTPGNNSHRYYTGAITTDKPIINVSATTHKMCVALKSDAVISTSSTLNISNGVANIMGTGTIVSTRAAANADLFNFSGGTLNLYGGNFRSQNAPTDYRFGVIRVSGTTAKTLNIWDGAVIGPATKDASKVALNLGIHNTGLTVNMYGGTIQNGVSPKAGFSGNVKLSNNAVFNMYGGTIKDGAFLTGISGDYGANVLAGAYSDAAGSGALTGGTFNMYGGTISGGNADHGGNVATNTAGATINMYSGTITGGVATQFGANVYVPTGTFNMYGGTVSGGSSTHGANICTNGGTANISGGTVSGGKASESGNVRAQNGTVNISGSALITGGNATNHGGNIGTATSSGTVNITGGKIAAGTSKTTGGNISGNGDVNIKGGIISGGTATTNGGNICINGTKVEISGGTIENGTAVAGGNIFLSVAQTISGGTIIGGEATAPDTNGGGNIFVTGAGSLTLTGGTITEGEAVLGGNIYTNGTVTINGANATVSDGSASSTTYGGGNIYVAKGTTTLTNGTISGGAAANGAGVFIVSGATMNVDGGTVREGAATASGGNFHVAGTLNVKGGTIFGGSATNNGGNVNIAGGGTVNISAGDLMTGTAASGGSIYVNTGTAGAGTLAITGGTINGGTATTGNGGNIYVNSSKVTISGGNIEDGSAPNGGNIFTNNALTISGGTISGGTATTGNGGNIMIPGAGSVTMTAGTISGGKAENGNGGNIHNNNKLTISGTAKLSGGLAKLGGNVNVEAGKTLTINGGTLENGEATTAGGNIRLAGTLTMTDGTISGGSAADSGGNIGVNNAAAKLNITGGTISGGTAGYEGATNPGFGGNIAISRGTEHSISGVVIMDGTVYGQIVGDDLTNGDGGNIGVHNAGTGAKLTITSCVITGGNAHLGGNIGVKGAELVVDATSTISGGTSTGEKFVGFESDNAYIEAASTQMGTNDAIETGLTVEAAAVTLDGQTATVEMNGKPLTIKGTGTVYAMDTANDSFDADVCGALTVDTGIVVMPEATNAANNYRYISLKKDNGTWNMHRVEIKLTAVTLRTTKGGIYYKSQIKGDNVVGQAVSAYGVAVSLNHMPGENFVADGDLYTEIAGAINFGPSHIAKMNSGSIFDIVKAGNTKAENKSNLTDEISANPYMAITRDGETCYVMGVQNASYSLHDVLDAINTGWDTDYADQQTMIKTNLAGWTEWFDAGVLDVYNNIFG